MTRNDESMIVAESSAHFKPDLNVGALMVVPLILIPSAIDAHILGADRVSV
jgi:hypothetical protein